MADALILNYNDAITTKDCAERLAKYAIIEHVLIVDNQSTDNSYEILSRIISKKISVISAPYNGGYGAGNNYGIDYLNKKYHTRYILLCNPDTIITEKSILALEQFLTTHKDYAVTAPVMLKNTGHYAHNTAFKIPTLWNYILSCGVLLGRFCQSFYYKNIFQNPNSFLEVDAVSGALLMINTEKMITYGMYDESIFLYGEEMRLGIKLKKHGLKTALLTKETFIHEHSVSINKTFKSEIKKRKLLIKSKLYTIKNYFNANPLEYRIACILAYISLLEIWLLSVIRKKQS